MMPAAGVCPDGRFGLAQNGHQTFGVDAWLLRNYHSKSSAEVVDSPTSVPEIEGGSMHHEVVVDGAGARPEWSVESRLALGLATLTGQGQSAKEVGMHS
jgi:hypothetical protein